MRRDFVRGVRDWLPIVGILVAYLVLHELGDDARRRSRTCNPQLGFDEWVFGGTAPTVRLQRALWHPGDPHWYDYLAWLVYLSHFVVTLDGRRSCCGCARTRCSGGSACCSSRSRSPGSLTYVLYPAIPPWLASRRGDMPHTVRIVRAMWLELGLSDVAAVFGEKSQYAFPVGALPSLHAAWPFLLLVFFWPIAGPTWRAVLVAYALAMAFTLVYTADHFVFDVLLGWTYVIVVVLVVPLRRRTRRRERVRSPASAAAAGSQDAERSGVDQAAVEVVVVGGEVEEAVAGVVEEDHALLAGLLGRERLVDRRRGSRGRSRARGPCPRRGRTAPRPRTSCPAGRRPPPCARSAPGCEMIGESPW